MSKRGRILIADNEEVFLQSTADLLRRHGYQCDCVSDAVQVAEKLKSANYDLLIADIRMPGNEQLELIKNITNMDDSIAVILVTGYPSLQTAIESVELPVVSYLVKPVELDKLLFEVENAIRKHRIYYSIHTIKEHPQHWNNCFVHIENALKSNRIESSYVSVESFIELAFQNVIDAILDIKHLTKSLTTANSKKEPCHLFNCPKLDTLDKGVNETIRVLEQTKGSFKSKELGKMRKKLEEIVEKE